MEKLGLEIPEFRLHRRVVIRTAGKPAGQVEVSHGRLVAGSSSSDLPSSQVSVSGADQLGYPFSFLKKVTVASGGRKIECCVEPFMATVPLPNWEGGAKKEEGVAIEVVFHAHYGEPPITLPVNVDSE